MPPQLAVIISQAPTRERHAAEIEEALVGELMMTGGLDANLVGPLERIEPDSTDLLCLGGFTQDIALLSWLPIQEAQNVWRNLQLTGTLFEYFPGAPSRTVISAIPLTGRRIAYLQLRSDSQPDKICQLLKARLQDMQVKTVSLLPLVPPPTSLPETTSKVPVTSPLFSEVRSYLPTTVTFGAASEVPDEEQWHKLDQLVDDLDALDL